MRERGDREGFEKKQMKNITNCRVGFIVLVGVEVTMIFHRVCLWS